MARAQDTFDWTELMGLRSQVAGQDDSLDLIFQYIDSLVLQLITSHSGAINGQLSFGYPKDLSDVQVLDNIEGAWASATVTALDTAVVFTHDLDVAVDAGGTPNVTWGPYRIEHDGFGAGATSTISFNFESGDTVNRNDIELRFYAAGRTVDGTHPLTVDIFFHKAVK